MSKVEVFEPALCCATGVCGEDVDQQLVRFSADLDFVRSRGGDVSRYNLASEPQRVRRIRHREERSCTLPDPTGYRWFWWTGSPR